MKMTTIYRILSLTIAMLLMGTAAQASRLDSVTVIKRKKVVYEDSSTYHRLDKTGFLGLQPIGFINYLPSYGIAAGVYASENALVQFEFNRGELGFSSIEFKGESFGASLKYFFGNSFYTKTGAGYRTLTLTDSQCTYCADTRNPVLASSSAVVADLAVGNQWQWENFTIGCDWVGAMIPIAGQQFTYNLSPKVFPQSQRSTESEIRSKAGRGVTSYQFLRLYLGASF